MILSIVREESNFYIKRGFTEEELDFIINYDIKYRMGKTLFGEDETKTEDE